MSNRLTATGRIDIVPEVEGPMSFDQSRIIIRQAEALRAEVVAHMAGVLWRAARAAGQRLLRSRTRDRFDAGLAELDDHTLADIGVTRTQIPGFAAREVAAARDVARRTRHLRAELHTA